MTVKIGSSSEFCSTSDYEQVDEHAEVSPQGPHACVHVDQVRMSLVLLHLCMCQRKKHGRMGVMMMRKTNNKHVKVQPHLFSLWSLKRTTECSPAPTPHTHFHLYFHHLHLSGWCVCANSHTAAPLWCRITVDTPSLRITNNSQLQTRAG